MYAGSWPDDFVPGMPSAQKAAYKTESDIEKPAQTPVMFDSIWINAWPLAKDVPGKDLFKGDSDRGAMMRRLCIPRHSFNSAAPRAFDPKDTLPGAVNMSFSDGHSELVKLEMLWSLSWHKNYEPPAKRPGR